MPLPATSRSLARTVDGVYRESPCSLVGARPARDFLLPAEGLISFAAGHHDGFRSGGISRLDYENVTRLYSETARNTIQQTPNRLIAIVSICIVWNTAGGIEHGLSSGDSVPSPCPMDTVKNSGALRAT